MSAREPGCLGMDIQISETRDIEREQVITLYKANGWSAADKPAELYRALLNSHSLITAWDGDRLVTIETENYSKTGSEKKIEEVDSGKTTLEKYDADGRILEESVSVGASRIESTRYRYVEGKLVESTRVYSGGSEQHRYLYDAEGVLSKESVYRNGVLQKVVIWTDKKTRYEDIYRNGKAVLRVHFEDDQKVDEEILR